MSKSEDNAGLMRSLGRFFGHITAAVRTPIETKPADRAELSRDIQEAEALDAEGRRVTLRRTTIDEIEVRE